MPAGKGTGRHADMVMDVGIFRDGRRNTQRQASTRRRMEVWQTLGKETRTETWKTEKRPRQRHHEKSAEAGANSS